MPRPWPLRRVAWVLLATVAGGCGVFDGDEPDVVAPEDFVLDCPLYCAVIMRRCRGTLAQFTSYDACLQTCAAYPADAPLQAATGNSLQCRFNFAVAVRKPTLHAFCRNAGPSGGVSCRQEE